MLIEDLGVTPDAVHKMTRRDVLDGNVDLIEHAAALLAEIPSVSLFAKIMRWSKTQIKVEATTRNVTRVDALLDDRPVATFDVKDGAQNLEVPCIEAGAVLELHGYRDGRLAAVHRPLRPQVAQRQARHEG